MPITGQHIGNIVIDIYSTSTGDTFYYVEWSNEDVINVLDHIQNSLEIN